MIMRAFLQNLIPLALSFFPLITTVVRADAQDFPAIKLRAYGTISGDRKTFPDDPKSSLLQITCESEPKAQLLLAKYLSDLGLLPGVSSAQLNSTRGPISARIVEGEGIVAAARCGSRVFISTAIDAPHLIALIQANLPADAKVDASDPEIPVPMYLDRWDKYGFRFYYGVFTKPQDAEHRDVPTYDPRQDFEFAQRADHSGLVVWTSPNRADTSEGITDTNSREWVYKTAREYKLPLGINIGLEDANISLNNRYPDDMTPNGPQVLGGWYGALNFGGNTVAWSSDAVQEIALAQLQVLMHRLLPRYGNNIVNWLEPHEEMGHGNIDWLDDHGPNAVPNFHRFLQSKYSSLAAVADRWGQAGAFKAWDDIPLPEIATFLGWNSDAFDLTGSWKINYEAKYGPESAGIDLDDSAWASIEAPGHSIVRILPRKPAVFRRHFKLDPAWRTAHPKVWLILLDMNETHERGDKPTPQTDVLAFMNGRALPENPPHRTETHWGTLDVSSIVQPGDNVLAVCLPQGILGYRVFLTGDEPRVYPNLTPAMNARWADFSDWVTWSRGQAVRRGAQMIRQVDPDRTITLMSPSDYEGPIKAVAEDYGGVFHDTGGMAGFWTDEPPLLMQSSGLASDCEPGGGASDLNDFKRFMGRWSTENTQGVDYFIHIGDVLWKAPIKEHFLKTQNLWHLIGKYHAPAPEVAVLDSDRNRRLFGFPWNPYDHQSPEPNLILANGYYAYGLQGQLMSEYPRATLLDEDFARGNADKFRVVIDSNTTIMDPDLVDQIGKYVERGGIFVTFQQTGRHTSVEHDAWPIAKLTGYSVTRVDPVGSDGVGLIRRRLKLANGQTLFHTDRPGWGEVENSWGLSLKKSDPACEDLLIWEDGSVAAGMRKVGKGYVINLGTGAARPLLWQILSWANLKRVPGVISDGIVTTRHFISNNGLYDIWVMFNQKDQPVTVDLKFRDGYKPASCRDVNTGQAILIDSCPYGAQLSKIALDTWQTRAFLCPRASLANAPLEWLGIQRSWWKGTVDPGPPIPPHKPRLALDLSDDWAFKALDHVPPGKIPQQNIALADPNLDDSQWERMQIGILSVPGHGEVRHAIVRKHFTVPPEWNHGRVMLRTHSDDFDGSRKYIDGKEIHASNTNDTLGGILTPGSTHVLAREFWSNDVLLGTRTPVWICYRPDPISSQPLPKDWSFAADNLRYNATVPLGTSTPGDGVLRCVIKLDSVHSDRNVVVHALASDTSIRALIFNGHWISGNGNISRGIDFNVTPWVKPGEENEVMIVTGTNTIQEASIDVYPKDRFP